MYSLVKITSTLSSEQTLVLPNAKRSIDDKATQFFSSPFTDVRIESKRIKRSVEGRNVDQRVGEAEREKQDKARHGVLDIKD